MEIRPRELPARLRLGFNEAMTFRSWKFAVLLADLFVPKPLQ